MNKHFYKLFALVFLLVSCNDNKKDTKAIQEVFENYKLAILANKGGEAYNYVDKRTKEYYSDILQKVKTADSLNLSLVSLQDKMLILSLRHRSTKNEILTMNNKGLFVYAINKGMISKNLSDNSIGKVTITGDFAKGQFVYNGKAAPFYFHFYKENEKWRIDLTSIFTISNMAFKEMLKESGESENEYIFELLENLTGRMPTNDIWLPLQK